MPKCSPGPSVLYLRAPCHKGQVRQWAFAIGAKGAKPYLRALEGKCPGVQVHRRASAQVRPGIGLSARPSYGRLAIRAKGA